ncbi:suppressor of fused domain protein [Actinoplanes siamensis]|uniref:Suppressor of fused protein SUFU n=1 Tax=Actinoplanes siamensis TaxID=1223317 RepID=A0A919TMK3_9ACTN|nr:suppressor of fused domain protein [Actinoplanes siamensis]GIF08421.1 hypothetical protein Asi03nite_59590 [Actinoplanes siamensis]
MPTFPEHLSAAVGSEPVIHRFVPADGGDDVQALVFAGFPEAGQVTGFTYGLATGRELALTVRTDDVEWGAVPARVAAALRGRHPFRPGQAIGYAGALVEGSPLTSLLLAEPIPAVRALVPHLGGVELVGVYPIHAAERDLTYATGFESLWDRPWDRLDPHREPVA